MSPVTNVNAQGGGHTFRVERDIEDKKFTDPDWDHTQSPGWKQHRIGDLHYFVDEQEVTHVEFTKAAVAAGILKEEERPEAGKT